MMVKDLPEVITVTKVNRTPLIELPLGLIETEDNQLYFEPDYQTAPTRARVPQKVRDLLAGKQEWERVEHEGWMWRHHIGDDFYRRTKYRLTEQVMPLVAPFFDGLEAVVNKPSRTSAIIPLDIIPLPDSPFFLYVELRDPISRLHSHFSYVRIAARIGRLPTALGGEMTATLPTQLGNFSFSYQPNSG